MFYMIYLSSVLFTLYSLIFMRSAIADGLFSIFCFVILDYLDRKKGLSGGAIVFVFVAVGLHLAGVLGVYSYFVYRFIGYDKVVHVFGSFAVCYVLLQTVEQRQRWLLVTFAIVLTAGFGSLVEIIEFIGTRYLDIDLGAGIFAMSDSLNQISDLQRYDTWFDMIFNLLGAVISALAAYLKNQTR